MYCIHFSVAFKLFKRPTPLLRSSCANSVFLQFAVSIYLRQIILISIYAAILGIVRHGLVASSPQCTIYLFFHKIHTHTHVAVFSLNFMAGHSLATNLLNCDLALEFRSDKVCFWIYLWCCRLAKEYGLFPACTRIKIKNKTCLRQKRCCNAMLLFFFILW